MSDGIWTSLRLRRPAAARARVPVIDQLARPVCTVGVGLGKAGPVTVLSDGLAVLADESGEPAESDPLSRIDPDCAGGDPFRCGEVGLGGQPGVEVGLVEEQLTSSAAVAAAGRERPGWPREAVAVPPVLPDVAGAAALPRSPRYAGWSGRAFARTLAVAITHRGLHRLGSARTVPPI
jgi:hypothetical protein